MCFQVARQCVRTSERRPARVRERVPRPDTGPDVSRRHGRQTESYIQVSITLLSS